MNEKLRILIVEDFLADAELVKHEIIQNKIDFESIVVDTGKHSMKLC